MTLLLTMQLCLSRSVCFYFIPFQILKSGVAPKGPMDSDVICLKRPNIRGWDVASNLVRACRRRLFYCELVASIHLSPPQSRHCDRVRCLKIPCEELCLPYGFILVCGDKECLHTVGLAQGSFISRINDSYSGIFTIRLSDNRSLVVGFALTATTWVTNCAPWKRKWHRKCWVRVCLANPCVWDLLIASLILLMNSSSQCLCPEWQHGTGHWVGSGDSEGVRCHLLCRCAVYFPLLKINRREKHQWMIKVLKTLVKTPSAHKNQKGVGTSENF